MIYAHAREAGAPYPPPLDTVQLPPNMPRAALGIPLQGKPQAAPGLQLPGTVTAAAVRPTPAGVATVRPVGAVPGVVAPDAATAGTAPASGPAAELRLIALFVAKWKLDPTRTKLMLAKLTPQKRRHVIQHFKATAGADPSNSLAQFV